MAPKIDEKSSLGHPRVEILRFWDAFWGGAIFDEFSIGKKWNKNQKNGDLGRQKGASGWWFWVGPAECAGPVGDYRGFKNLKIWERIWNEI